jgi:hypothetical protein
VRRCQCSGHVPGIADGDINRQGLALESFGERLTLEQFHHQVIRVAFTADVVQSADVLVLQTGDDLCFPAESCAVLRVHDAVG